MLKRILASDAIVSSLYRRRRQRDLIERLKQGRPKLGSVHMGHSVQKLTRPVNRK